MNKTMNLPRKKKEMDGLEIIYLEINSILLILSIFKNDAQQINHESFSVIVRHLQCTVNCRNIRYIKGRIFIHLMQSIKISGP